MAREGSSPKDELLAKLRDLVPGAFTEGRIDFAQLRALLGDTVAADKAERFTFTWAGRRNAIRSYQAPSRATLTPALDQSLGWDETNNAFIEGENLEVLKLLSKSYFNRVKLIYIDPPYNTGKADEFVYPDDFSMPLERYFVLTDQKDANGNATTSARETSGRYHSNWLSMMYPRLMYARQLLRDDGVILASIDDHEVHSLRALVNDVFGEENFIAQLT